MKKIVMAQKRLDKTIDDAKKFCAEYVDIEKIEEALQRSEKNLVLYEKITGRGMLGERLLTKDQRMEFSVWIRQEQCRIKHYKKMLGNQGGMM